MFYSQTIMYVSLTLVLLVLPAAMAKDPVYVNRPIGVPLAHATLYSSGKNGMWACFSGEKSLPYDRINDDYCDCADGSDEPGTSACTHGVFHCINAGHIPLDLPSSRVNDGICDCCDGSDEYMDVDEKCKDVCLELGHAEEEKRKSEAELHKLGATKRAEMITKGKKLQTERLMRRAELESQRVEQEAIKAEKEEIKRNAETAEAEALEVYKEQQREQDVAAVDTEEDPENARLEAEASFVRYDTNKDGFVEVTELQIDLTFDRDRNGVVTVEEAKYFLDERDRIDLDAFITLSWPRIKPIQMLAQGLFKPPQVNNAESDKKQVEDSLEENQEENKENANHEELEAEEEEDAYEDEEADVGVGTVTPDTTHPVYDPETQRFIDVANEARNAFAEVERTLREITHEMKELEDMGGKDYGPEEEYATMDGECFTFEDREYVYTLCPFDRASQKSRSGGAETTLGRWDNWIREGNNRYSKQKYLHGASCWNGPQRSAIVQIKCALETSIISVAEPNRCEYFFEFETPAACDPVAYNQTSVEKKHDEL